jgi:tetratricopeptide (TPR) repeat protein
MKKLNVKLLLWVAALGLLLGLGVFWLHSIQTHRIARAFLWQAEHAEEEGRFEVAVGFLFRYLELEPGSNEERAHLGRLLADRKIATSPRARQRALFVLEQVVTREPDRLDSRCLLVRMALALGRNASALEHLLAMHNAAPKDGEILELLGRTYEAIGKAEDAKASYEKAIEVAPHELGPYERLARLLRLHPDEANRENPRDPDTIMDLLVKNNQGSVPALLARWNYVAESGLLERVGSLLISNAAAEGRRAAQLEEATSQKLDQVEKDLKRALALAPEDIEVLLAMAELAQVRGRTEEARKFLARGQSLRADDPRLYRHAAAVELRDGKSNEALVRLREGIKAVPARLQGELRWTLANLLIDQDRADEARTELSRLEKGGFGRAALDFLNARLLISEGKWAQGARLFERVRAALEAVPGLDRDGEVFLAQTNLLLGRCYEQLNDAARQMAAYARLAARNPASSAAHLSLASAHVAAGRLDEALNEFRQALALPDAPPRVAIDYARLLVLRNLQRTLPDWNAANQALDRAAKVQPDAPEVVLLRGEALLAQNQVAAARKLIEEARARKPKQAEFHTALAGLYVRQGDYKAAATVLDEAEQQAGDSVDLRLARAWLWVNERDASKRERLSSALAGLVGDLDKFAPEDRARLLEEVSTACNRVGDGKQALALWDQLARQPRCHNDLRVQFCLAELALQVGDDVLVRRGLDEVQRIEVGQGTLWRLGEALRLIRQGGDAPALQQAREHLDAAEAARPGWVAARIARAELEERAGRTEAALNEYRVAINLGDSSPRVVRRMVELLNKRQRFREAAEEIRKLKRKAPLTEELRRLEVDLALRNHESGNAVQRALELVNPDSNDYRDALWLGQVLSESGQRPEQAEVHLRRAVALAPDVPETWVVLVEFLAAQHRDQAEAEIAKATTKLPKEQADLALAQCYEAVGKLEESRRHYDAALAAHPNDAAIVRGLAGFCVRAGRLEEAERHLRQLSERKTDATAEDAAWARRNLAWVRAATGGQQGINEALALVGLRLDSAGKVVSAEGDLPPAQYRQEQQARARVLAVHNRRAFRRQAIAILEELNRQETLGPDDLYLLAQLHEADGNWMRARQEFRDLLAGQAEMPVFLAQFIQGLLRHGDLDEARTCLERLERLEQTRKVEPGTFGSARLRAGYLQARGEGDKALELLRANVARKDARSEEVLLLIGYLAGRKQTDAALDACEQAWKTCALEAAARASLATLRSGKPTEAQIARVERWLREAQEKIPNAAAPLLFLAELRDLQGKYGEAETLYRQVLKTDRANATALNNLAWLLVQERGQAAEALELINRAIELHGPAPSLLDTRATVNLARDHAEAAVRDLQEATADSPGGSRLFQLAHAHLKAKDRAAAVKAFAEAKRLGFDPQQLHPLQQESARRIVRELEVR